MSWFLGIDGGGTRTRALVVDAEGRVAAWSESGLSNPNHASFEAASTHLEEAIQGACQQAGAERRDCVSIFLGMAGVTEDKGRALVRRMAVQAGLGHATIGVDHDIRIALAGGLGGRPGIALIVGTGSSCYGRAADGRTWQTGGWEALISDEGSGFYLGREALAAAARMADGRDSASPLRERVFQWLGISDIAQILNVLHQEKFTRSDIAAFAPQVVDLAGSGDAAALQILDRGARLLAELVAANHRQLPTGPFPDVVMTGGLGTAQTLYRALIESAIGQLLPEVRLHQPLLAPVIGAALLALEQTGHEVTDQLRQRLRTWSAGSLPPPRPPSALDT